MQMQQPSYFPSGASVGMRLNGSAMAGSPFPIAYIAVPVSEPFKQSQQLLWQQPPMLKPPGLTEPLRKAVAGLGSTQIVVGLSSIALEIFITVTSTYTNIFYAGFWCGPIFLMTGIVACSAAKARKTGLIIGTMVMSIISSLMFICQFLFSLFQAAAGRSFPIVVTSGLLMGLSVLELSISIACAACCCRAICRHGCCCENIDQSRLEQINQNSFASQAWTANPSQPNVGQLPYSPAPGFPMQSQSSYLAPSEIYGQGAAAVGGGNSDGAGPSSTVRT